jgi:hypothetical protein
MIRATDCDAPRRRFSAGPYATTTASFEDAIVVAATAWQEAPPRPPARRSSAARLFATSAVSIPLVAFSPTVDANGSEPVSAADAAPKGFERATAQVETDAASIPEEGIYAPPRPRRVLHSEVVEFQTDKLPRRKPRITCDDSYLAVIDDD